MCKCSGKCGCNITSTTKGEKGDASPVASLGYKVYKVLISQDSTSNPTITSNGGGSGTPLVNTVGSITLTRTNIGVYDLTSDGLFTLNKTFMTWGASAASFSASLIILEHVDVNTITINTFNSSNSNTDGILYNTPIEIQVYN